MRSVTRRVASCDNALTACANFSLSVRMPATSKRSSALVNQMAGLLTKTPATASCRLSAAGCDVADDLLAEALLLRHPLQPACPETGCFVATL